MVPFPTNPHRLVPYKSFKFQLVLDGDVVAGPGRLLQALGHRPIQGLEADLAVQECVEQ